MLHAISAGISGEHAARCFLLPHQFVSHVNAGVAQRLDAGQYLEQAPTLTGHEAERWRNRHHHEETREGMERPKAVKKVAEVKK